MSFTRTALGSALLFPLLSRCDSCSLNSGPGPGVAHHEVGGNGSSVWPWQIYKSSSFNPPIMEITTNGEPLAPGYIVTTQSDFSSVPAIKEPAPLIMTDTGELVWSGPISNTTNLFVQTFKGKQVLHYWTGLSTAGGNVGHGYGNVTILDTSYNIIATVCPDLGLNIPGNQTFDCTIDLHESFLTDRNTLLVSAYNATPIDLSPVNGPTNGWGFDSLFFEVDPETDEILFRWSAQEHVPVTHSHQPRNGVGVNESVPYDWFHINSVVNIGDYYLVNARHTWETYLLDRDGNVVWTINGETGGDFGPLPDGATFRWQHFARPHNITNSSVAISWFDNNNQALDNGTNPSIGLELLLSIQSLNSSGQGLQLVKRLVDSTDNIYADSQGSYESDLHNTGNGFMTYGEIPVIKEFGPNSTGGDVRWTGRLGGDNLAQLYRGYKQIWHANPFGNPSLVIEKNTANACPAAYGYVSWNGATEVTGWSVYEGSSNGSLTHVGTADFKGFETRFIVGSDAQCVQVAAVVDGRETTKSSVECF